MNKLDNLIENFRKSPLATMLAITIIALTYISKTHINSLNVIINNGIVEIKSKNEVIQMKDRKIELKDSLIKIMSYDLGRCSNTLNLKP